MVFQSLTFNELTPRQVYEILRARCAVFMVEQRIVCQDMDRVDYQSRHLFLEKDGAVIAYLRAYYIEPETVQLGRVLTLQHGLGQGRLLMERSLAAIAQAMPCRRLTLHSQTHAVGFYEKFGFRVVSEEFMEEGVPHVTMEKQI